MTIPAFTKKPIAWLGSSLEDIKDARIFTVNARKEAGHQLDRAQSGLDPVDCKPFDTVGPGAKEIRIGLDDGWFRVIYVAKFEEAVYVLHWFKKKSNKTSKMDISIAERRYKRVLQERKTR